MRRAKQLEGMPWGKATGRFLRLLIDEARLRQIVDEHREELEARTARHWFRGETRANFKPLGPTTERQEFFLRIFPDFNEMFDAIRNLELTSRFLHKLQPRTATADEIAYHIEKHLEEFYILRERIETFTKRLERRAKRRSLHAEARALQSARERALKGLDGIVRTRGSHVHQERFRDADVERVSSLDFLVNHGEMLELEPLRRHHVRSVLTKWRKTAQDNVQKLGGVMEHLFLVVEPIVVEKLAPADGPPR